MSLTEKVAIKIGNSARIYLNVDEDNEQIITYGAITLLQTVFSILWVVIFGLLFGVLYEAMIFSFTNAILRKYSGGVHASSPSRCIILGTTTAVIAGICISHILCKLNMVTVLWMSIVFMIFSLIIIIINAPVDSIKKPITDSALKKQFKIKSVIVIVILLFISVFLFILSQKNLGLNYERITESISFGVLWQTITITKGGISLVNKVDFGLKYLIEGGEKYDKHN